MPVNAVILCRISDTKQDDGYSLDAQEKYGKEYCKANDFKILKTFRFVETGSKSHKRQKFDGMMDFIKDQIGAKSKGALKLIVEKPDRLTRNFTNREQLQFFVMTGKLEIHYYKDRRVFDRNCGPADIFTDDMMTSVSKYISLNIAREVNKGMKQKAESGWFPGRPPLGYKNIRVGKVDKNGRKEAKIIVDPETMPIAKRIFELRAIEKYSYESIRKTILAEKLLSEKKAKTFHKTSVEKVLLNTFYIGKFEWKGEIYQGKHEVFIPKTWFELAKGLRGKTITNNYVGAFSNYLKCGIDDCGCSIIYDPKKKFIKSKDKWSTYHYYHCADGKRLHKKLGHKQTNVAEQKLWDQFESLVGSITLDENLAGDILKSLKESENQHKNDNASEKDFLKDQIEETTKKQEQLYDHFLEELIDEVTYRRKLKELKTKKQELERKLENQSQPKNKTVLPAAQNLLELATELKSLWKMMSDDEKLIVVKRLCSNPTLTGAKLDYHLRKPFLILQNLKKTEGNQKWCAWRESNPHALRH